MSLNLYSVTCLTSVFLSKFNYDAAERCIVNITSLSGIQPCKSVGYYCVGKASREMYFRVLALENPSLSVLSYCPGKNIVQKIVVQNLICIFIPIFRSGFNRYARRNLFEFKR